MKLIDIISVIGSDRVGLQRYDIRKPLGQQVELLGYFDKITIPVHYNQYHVGCIKTELVDGSAMMMITVYDVAMFEEALKND